MAYGAGVGAILGVADETTFGTWVEPTEWTEFTSESLTYVKNTVVSQGLRGGGTLPRIQRRVVATYGGSGQVTFDLTDVGLDLWLGHATGDVAGAGTYVLADPLGYSFSTTLSVPLFDGTLDNKKLSGCKISDWTLSVPNGGIATMQATIDAAKFERGTVTATPSYTAGANLFQFAGASIKIGGSTVAYVSDFALTVSNTLKTDRYTLGGAGAKLEQIVNGFRSVTGTLNAEFIDTTVTAAILADTDSEIELTLVAGTTTITVALPSLKWDGDVPQVGGPEAVMQTMNFTAYDNGTDEPLTITVTTGV